VGEVVALIKPQFEAGRVDVARGKGVVRDPEIHRRVLMDVLSFAVTEDYIIKGLARSPVLGPKGNVEFFGWFQIPGGNVPTGIPIEALVSQAVEIE
jgi:23S rRNA (cytidine1920-2'-O)/16S rRNA (cytidine1409-2'-O)-methyltransferase